MKKACLFIFFTFFILTPLSFGAMIEVDEVIESTQSIRAWEKSSGKALWRSEVAVQKGDGFIFVLEEGRGIYGNDKQNRNWRTESFFHHNNKQIVPYQTKYILKEEKGDIVTKLDKYFDAKDKQVVCIIDEKTKRYVFVDDLLERSALGIVLPHFPFVRGKEISQHLLTHEPAMYKVNFKPLGQETVEAGAESIECYKLEMTVDLGALNIIGAFVPKTYFWYNVKSPHRFVRYEGLESGLGTPYIVMQVDS